MSVQQLFLRAFVLWSAFLLDNHGIQACDLCPDTLYVYYSAGPIPERNNWYVEEGITCNDKYLSVAGSENDSPECIDLIANFKDVCCYTDRAGTQAPQPPPPTVAPGSVPLGSEPPCDICRGGDFPGYPQNIIFSNFIRDGSATCERLFQDGLDGHILAPVCVPLERYVRDPCGCGLAAPTVPTRAPTVVPAPTPAPTWPQRTQRALTTRKDTLKEAYLSELSIYRSCRGCLGNRVRDRRRGLRGEPLSTQAGTRIRSVLAP